ncbi:secretion protein HlyD [Leptolyngbya boryana NIES-2135]|jgi:HlyD family secretion protein|uniref:Secretion protein HlyD n=1 Tax=Leptolyngbya boryana NIES-2135 TaxID=1973484 RepID=A0A1Z4J9T5_LEPBY|nr:MULTISPECIES: ABC exporter membrane fusion protein [Leptolyngbya]BAY53526.1 secretion protein HlyD [Leptolyngbya boryana NIES-2135]MBD2366614.1 ABC exporter membrane fusion protein [Leptolyngbya sp. FACHB-161]MBD2373373.1 ABC exporter membrane fusion protein [Leptolyngbya sp. FACHB-238]MBD2397772.1 ABC exporter membrane fusion protein [Leptolyngbya sp. FACHB-239]MBD2407432.1 ABC exporter membrane fusion protein [Leptolyngbya sp. FACHB-402]
MQQIQPRSIGIAVILTAFGAIALYQFRPKTVAVAISDAPAIQAITALGRLEPKGEVIQLAANPPGSRIAELRVKLGDRVRKGQIIAVLDTHDRALAALTQAQKRVGIAQAKLAQVEAGAKRGEISAQQATIDRTEVQLREDVAAKDAAIAKLEAEVKNAELEFQRYEFLEKQGAISTSLKDGKRLTLDVSRQQLAEAKANRRQAAETIAKQVKEAEATLDRIAEVRPVDIEAAQAEVQSAIAAVQQTQAELDLTVVRAPRDGQILKVHTWEGEIIDSKNGIVSIGQTDVMYAVAEVYETDLPKIRVGQAATMTSVSGGKLARSLKGKVDEIGLEVAKKDVLNTDPAASIDARVVEVKVRLDPEDSQSVAGLTNMKLQIAIGLQ